MSASSRAPVERAQIVSIARRWIGTPFHHQASLEAAGCDCIGLVRGIYRELLGREPQALPGYSRDWAEATREEALLAAARTHLVECPLGVAHDGDILLFRFRNHLVAKHAAVLATAADGKPSLIHALEGAGVVEVPFSGWWRRRIAAVFSFPGIID